MLSLKKVKSGKVAYIFEGEYAEIAVKLFPVISSKVIGIEPPADGVVKKERTLADVVNKVEKPMIQSLTLNIPKTRSEEHTSELQSRENLVCRLLLEKKKEN